MADKVHVYFLGRPAHEQRQRQKEKEKDRRWVVGAFNHLCEFACFCLGQAKGKKPEVAKMNSSSSD